MIINLIRKHYYKLLIRYTVFKKYKLRSPTESKLNPPKPESMKFRKTVAVTDDHLIFRKGFIGLLREHKHLDIVFEAENGKDLIDQLKDTQPDVIFLDIQMPKMNGIEAAIYIREKYPAIRIIILTSHYDEELMYHLIEKGVHGFFSKNTPIEELITAIDKVMAQGFCFNFEVANAMAKGILINNKLRPEFRASKLSLREQEVVKLICKELTNREIADQLCLSARTIDTYRDKIFAKTGVKNAVGLAFYALKYGLIDM